MARDLATSSVPLASTSPLLFWVVNVKQYPCWLSVLHPPQYWNFLVGLVPFSLLTLPSALGNGVSAEILWWVFFLYIIYFSMSTSFSHSLYFFHLLQNIMKCFYIENSIISPCLKSYLHRDCVPHPGFLTEC